MDTPSIPLKRCSKKENCIHPKAQDGGWLPANLEFFYKKKEGKDGLCAICKDCEKERVRLYNEAQPLRARQRSKQWREDHPEQERETKRIYRATYPDRVRESFLRWYAEHSERVRAYSRNRAARERNAEGTHTLADEQAQFDRQKGHCYYCGCKLTKTPRLPNSSHVDHVVPLDRGGRNSPDNLVIACQHCNCGKKNKLPHEWIQGGRLL